MQTSDHVEGPAEPPVTASRHMLVVQSGSRRVAFDLASVQEVTRPLPIEIVSGSLPYVLGLTIVRGVPVPVIDLALLIDIPGPVPINRFVILGQADRCIAVAVEQIIGSRDIAASELWSLASVLPEARSSPLRAVNVEDRHLLFVLEAGRLVADAFEREHEPAVVPA